MKKIIFTLLFLFLPVFTFAETIILNNSKVIEGTIVEKTDEKVKVDIGMDFAVTYYLDEIESIDGKGIKKNFQQAERSKKQKEREEIKSEPNSQIVYEEGMSYYNNQDFDKAIERFEYLIKKDPNFIDAYHKLAGIHHLVFGETEEAIFLMEKAIARDPLNVNSYISLGSIYVDLKDFEKAKNYFQKGFEIDPQNAVVNVKLGVCYFFNGQYNEAIKYFETAINVKPNNLTEFNQLESMTYYLLLSSYVDIGEINKAEQVFWKALKKNHKYSSGAISIGIYYITSNEYKPAIEIFESAIRLNPEFISGIISLGYLYIEMGVNQKDMEFLEKGKRLLSRTKKMFRSKRDEISSSTDRMTLPPLRKFLLNRKNTLDGLKKYEEEVRQIEDTITDIDLYIRNVLSRQ